MAKRLSSLSPVSWLFFLLAICGAIAVGEACSGSPERQAPGDGRAQDPLDGIEALIAARKHTEAQAALRQVQQDYRSKGDQHGEAICLLLLGIGELRATNLSAAITNIEQAGAMLAVLDDRLGVWITEWLLGSLTAGGGRFETAIVHFERALDILRHAGGSHDPHSLRALRHARSSLLLPDDVAKRLQLGQQGVAPDLLHFLEAMSRDGYVWVLVLSGRLAEAELELSRLAEFSHRIGGRFDGLVELHRGELRRKQGRIGEARESLGRALDSASSLPPAPFRDERPELQILESLVDVELLSGRCDQALDWSDQTLERLRIRDAPNGRSSVLVRVNRAGIFTQCGGLAAAETTLLEALDFAKQGGHVYLQATTATQLGRLLAEPGRRFEEAARHLETAVGLFQKVDAPLEEAKAWMLLSECYVHLEACDLARGSLERARKLATRNGIHRVEAVLEQIAAAQQTRCGLAAGGATGENLEPLLKVLGELRASMAGEGLETSFLGPFLEGYLRFKRGEVGAARDLWTMALKGAPTRELEAYLQGAIGVTYWAEGKIDTALPYFDRAVAGVEATIGDMRVEELLATFLGGPRQGFFHALVDMLVLEGRSKEAFGYAERARARAFLQSLGNQRIRPHSGADARLVDESEELRTRILGLEQALSVSPSEKAWLSAELRDARQQYQSLLVRLKVSGSGEYASLTRIEPLDLEAVQNALPQASTLISFFVSLDRVHVWVIDRETLHHVALPLGPEDLRRAVCWADEVAHNVRGARSMVSRCGSARANHDELYVKLIAPLASKIRHSKLVLIPHGELHYLPFAALRNPDNGRFLIEDYTLNYAPSASSLGFLRAKETPVEGKALVLGAPTRLERDLKPLRGMATEAMAVARLLRDDPQLGPRATESRLYGLDGKLDLIHIAAHASYDPASPLFSRIALTPGKQHDGNLEVHEILSELDLSGVNLVVLSACETARGERSGGDEITSLTRAFLYAGSPAVISTLWKIDDAASTVLMEELYRRLLDGASVDEALRQAQLSLLRNPRYKEDPYFWAAFSLTGDPQGSWTAPDSSVAPRAQVDRAAGGIVMTKDSP